MSNHRIDALEKEFLEYGEILDFYITPPHTYIVIHIGHLTGVGHTTCGDDDTFDMMLGFNIALRRALKHIAQQQEAMPVLANENIAITYDYESAMGAPIIAEVAR